MQDISCTSYILRGNFYVFSFSGIKNVLNSLDVRRMLTHGNKNNPLQASFTGALHEYFVKHFYQGAKSFWQIPWNNFHGTRQIICMESHFDNWVSMQRSFAKNCYSWQFLGNSWDRRIERKRERGQYLEFLQRLCCQAKSFISCPRDKILYNCRCSLLIQCQPAPWCSCDVIRPAAKIEASSVDELHWKGRVRRICIVGGNSREIPRKFLFSERLEERNTGLREGVITCKKLRPSRVTS